MNDYANVIPRVIFFLYSTEPLKINLTEHIN